MNLRLKKETKERKKRKENILLSVFTQGEVWIGIMVILVKLLQEKLDEIISFNKILVDFFGSSQLLENEL